MLAAVVAPRPHGIASQCGLPPATTEMSLAWVARPGTSLSCHVAGRRVSISKKEKKMSETCCSLAAGPLLQELSRRMCLGTTGVARSLPLVS